MLFRSSYLFAVSGADNLRTPRMEVEVEGVPVIMTVDSGASENVIDEAAYEMLTPRPKLSTPSSRLYPFGAGAGELMQFGQFVAILSANERVCRATVHVVKGPTGCLLSHKIARQLALYQTSLFSEIRTNV